jgi:hypothetical protein
MSLPVGRTEVVGESEKLAKKTTTLEHSSSDGRFHDCPGGDCAKDKVAMAAGVVIILLTRRDSADQLSAPHGQLH